VRDEGGGGDASGVVVGIGGDSGTGGDGACLLRFAGRAETSRGGEHFGGIFTFFFTGEVARVEELGFWMLCVCVLRNGGCSRYKHDK
jgi:hypothetical protein